MKKTLLIVSIFLTVCGVICLAVSGLNYQACASFLKGSESYSEFHTKAVITLIAGLFSAVLGVGGAVVSFVQKRK